MSDPRSMRPPAMPRAHQLGHNARRMGETLHGAHDAGQGRLRRRPNQPSCRKPPCGGVLRSRVTKPCYKAFEALAYRAGVLGEGEVFEDLLCTLGLVDFAGPLTDMIAKKVIELAQSGERDPARLKRVTPGAFQQTWRAIPKKS